MNINNNNIKLFGNKEKPKIKDDIINNINNYYKKEKVNTERILTNYQFNPKNSEEEDIINDLKNIKEQEDKMNLIKNEINNKKLESNFRIQSEKRNKENFLSELNLDIGKITNTQSPLSNPKRKNDEEFNKKINNEINNEKIDNNNNINDKKYGKIKKVKKINSDSIFNKIKSTGKIIHGQNNISEDITKKGIFDKLKIENINLKVKNGLLKASLEKKDKIIEALNNKIKELENSRKINNNINEIDYNDTEKNQINDLQNKNKELLKHNQNLILGIETFNDRIKEISTMLEKKNKKFKNEIDNYKKKLSEYRKKIILLKTKVKELYKTNPYLNENENLLDSLKINSSHRYNKSFIFNRNNLFHKKNIFDTDIENLRKKEDNMFDEKEKLSHHRYNTFLYQYNNYLNE